jgi:hypothetical protein
MKNKIYKRFALSILHATSASALASMVCYFYATFYFGLLVDFSEGASIWPLLGRYFVLSGILTLPISIIYQFIICSGLNYSRIGEMLMGLVFSGLTVALVFYVLKMKEPVFKKEDTILFVDFFKGFLMPMLFFPLLAWFTLKPLFAAPK